MMKLTSMVLRGLLVHVWIQIITSASTFICLFFFFLEAYFVAVVFSQWVSYIVHETHKLLFSTKILLKMGPTALLTHLKIILL